VSVLPSVRHVVAAVALATFGAASACTFLLDGIPEELGNRCAFDGETTTCGNCLATSCRDAIDACCADECGTVLDKLEECALDHGPETCAQLKAANEDDDSDEDDERARDLALCVRSECDEECPSSAPVTHCVETDDGCSCVVDTDNPNDSACKPSTGKCCADPGYPAEGLECLCVEIGCSGDDGRCACGVDGGNKRTCDDLELPFCCIAEDGCVCRDYLECFDDETATGSCSVEIFDCGSRVERDSCQATENDLN